MSDEIKKLPTDQSLPSPNEVQILNTLFQHKYSAVQKIMSQTKDVLLIGLLYILFSLPQIDDMIRKLIPVTTSSIYMLIFVKALLFMLIYFIIKNLYLVKKQN